MSDPQDINTHLEKAQNTYNYNTKGYNCSGVVILMNNLVYILSYNIGITENKMFINIASSGYVCIVSP
jgi:hypothetical protein